MLPHPPLPSAFKALLCKVELAIQFECKDNILFKNRKIFKMFLCEKKRKRFLTAAKDMKNPLRRSLFCGTLGKGLYL